MNEKTAAPATPAPAAWTHEAAEQAASAARREWADASPWIRGREGVRPLWEAYRAAKAAAAAAATWTHEGPDGVDAVEWWTTPGSLLGVTRDRSDPEWRVALVETGEDALGPRRFDDVAAAMAAAEAAV